MISVGGLFQLPVPLLQHLQPASVGHCHATVLGLSFYDGRAADLRLAVDIRCLHARFLLLRGPDDPLFLNLDWLHRPCPIQGPWLKPFLQELPWLRSPRAALARLATVSLREIQIITNIIFRTWVLDGLSMGNPGEILPLHSPRGL